MIGRGGRTNCRIFQPIDFIEFELRDLSDLFAKAHELFCAGASLREIAKTLKVSRDTVRRTLRNGGLTFEANWGDSDYPDPRLRPRPITKPPFGYSVQNGKLVNHPTESVTRQEILKLWSEGKNYSAIASELNSRGLRPRHAKFWDHSAIRRIVKRHDGSK